MARHLWREQSPATKLQWKIKKREKTVSKNDSGGGETVRQKKGKDSMKNWRGRGIEAEKANARKNNR